MIRHRGWGWASSLALLVISCSGRSSNTVPRAGAAPATPAPSSTELSAWVAPDTPNLADHRAIPLAVGINYEPVVLSPDDTLIATADEDGNVYLVERESRRLRHRFPCDGGEDHGIAFSDDGTTLAFTCLDGVRVFRIDGKGAPRRVATWPGSRAKLAFCDGHWVIGRSAPGPGGVGARVVDTEGVTVATLSIRGRYLQGLSCDQQAIALAGATGVTMFSAASYAKLGHAPTSGKDYLVDLALSRGYLAAQGNYGTVWLWNRETLKLEASVPAVAGQAQRLIFHPASPVLIAGATLLSLPKLRVLREWRGFQYMHGLAMTRDGATLIQGTTYGLASLDFDALTSKADPVGAVWRTHELVASPSGQHLVSGDRGRFYVWHLGAAGTGLMKGPLLASRPTSGPGDVVLAFSADGKLLYSGSSGVLEVWTFPGLERRAVWSMPKHDDVRSLLTTDGLVIAAGSHHVYLLHARTGAAQTTLGSFEVEHFGSSVENISLTPDGKLLAIGIRTGKASIFRLPSAELHKELPLLAQGHGQVLRFSPDGKRLLRGATQTAELWAVPSWKREAKLQLPWFHSWAWSPDSRRGAWSGVNSGLGAADLHAQPTRVLWDREEIDGLLWGRNFLYTSSHSGQLQVRDPRTGDPRQRWISETGANVEMLAFSPDGRHLAVAQDGARYRIWNLDSYRPTDVAQAPPGGGDTSALRLTDGQLITATDDGKVRVFDWAGDELQLRPSAASPTRYPVQSAIPRDARRVLQTVRRGGLRWRDLASGASKPVLGPMTSTTEFRSIRVSADARYLAARVSRAGKETLELWDLQTAQLLRRQDLGETQPWHGFAHDSLIVHTMVDDPQPINRVDAWPLTGGKPTQPCPGLDFLPLHSVALQAKGTRLVGLGGGVHITNLETCRTELSVLAGPVLFATATLSPDGTLLAVASVSGTVYLWDVPSGKRLAELDNLAGRFWRARTADGVADNLGVTAQHK